jgi:hypothetical protein
VPNNDYRIEQDERTTRHAGGSTAVEKRSRFFLSNPISLMPHLFDIERVLLKIGINKLLAARSHLRLSSSIG